MVGSAGSDVTCASSLLNVLYNMSKWKIHEEVDEDETTCGCKVPTVSATMAIITIPQEDKATKSSHRRSPRRATTKAKQQIMMLMLA